MPALDLDPATGRLPPGRHHASLDEVVSAFGAGPQRLRLVDGLLWVASRLEQKGVTTIWIDGSFVTDKHRPRDVDVIYLPPRGADPRTWGVLSPSRRKELKAAYRVDLWPHPSPQPKRVGFGHEPLIDLFTHDRDGTEKGIVEVTLAESEQQGDARP
jgi:hypothetical protein